MEELTRQTHGRIRQTQMSALYEGFHFRNSQADQVDEEREKKRDVSAASKPACNKKIPTNSDGSKEREGRDEKKAESSTRGGGRRAETKVKSHEKASPSKGSKERAEKRGDEEEEEEAVEGKHFSNAAKMKARRFATITTMQGLVR